MSNTVREGRREALGLTRRPQTLQMAKIYLYENCFPSPSLHNLLLIPCHLNRRCTRFRTVLTEKSQDEIRFESGDTLEACLWFWWFYRPPGWLVQPFDSRRAFQEEIVNLIRLIVLGEESEIQPEMTLRQNVWVTGFPIIVMIPLEFSFCARRFPDDMYSDSFFNTGIWILCDFKKTA